MKRTETIKHLIRDYMNAVSEYRKTFPSKDEVFGKYSGSGSKRDDFAPESAGI